MQKADIGLIGLGVMGANLALNIADNGYVIAVNNRTASEIDKFIAEAGALQDKIIGQAELADFVASIKRPRSIIIMIKAGQPVDDMIAQLIPLLDKGDAIIECGNSLFTDTERRFAELKPYGIGYLGVGVSGGEEGARHGPSIMVGGSKDQWHDAEEVLKAISAKFNGEPCCAYLGEGGAGHFVKMVHNGIEYADMQMIAEIYGVMRDGLRMTPAECASVFRKWNKGPLNSYLIEITAEVLDFVDPETDAPIVDLIVDKAGQKGTGRWTAIAAQELAVPATAIEGAVAARSLSALKDERRNGEAIYGGRPGTKPDVTIDDLEQALLTGKIVAYAQGFAILQAASDEHGWDLPLATISKIWRAGCIIRSKFLDQMAAAYETSKGNLLTVPDFVEIMRQGHGQLRKVVAQSSLSELPVICLSSSLSYFDSYRQARGTANLIQGLRDFFGAHSFEVDGREGPQHADWPIVK